MEVKLVQFVRRHHPQHVQNHLFLDKVPRNINLKIRWMWTLRKSFLSVSLYLQLSWNCNQKIPFSTLWWRRVFWRTSVLFAELLMPLIWTSGDVLFALCRGILVTLLWDSPLGSQHGNWAETRQEKSLLTELCHHAFYIFVLTMIQM